MPELQTYNCMLENSQTKRVGEVDCGVEGRDDMKGTSEVKGPCLVPRLAGLPDEFKEESIERELPVSEFLRRLLITDPVTKDVQKKGFMDGAEEDQ